MDEEGNRDGAGANSKDLQPLVLSITLSPSQLSDTRRSADKAKREEAVYDRKYLYTEERFVRNALPDPSRLRIVARWRMRERMKTVSVALLYCLNIGVDPPDIVKPNPCARLECWTDPLAYPPQKALENIGKALQAQYERWQPRARYKQCLDPTVEDVKKLCLSLRRNAREERVLFHYNGHGVPKPTNNGELWVFNKNYTQYIPLSLYELQSWIQSPSIFVFDCSAAALVIHWFTQFAEQREKESAQVDRSKLDAAAAAALPVIQLKDCILLAACAANETLPTNPDLPADLFTSCLTTPIKAALRYCSQTILSGITFDSIEKIPGRLNDRKTPLGELNWIFTAITDTIAWNVLPSDLFQKLFRQDLLVASLFRNFLLAERVMRSVNCTPTSFPKLPPTFQHPMWQAWDMAVDLLKETYLDPGLSQLPAGNDPVPEVFRPSPFFSEQLTAFEVWLEFGSEHKRAPEQLPVVLQVLLSQTHRLRALVLLARFLDLGPWAVNLALSVGIFPYVLKLLQSQALELRQVLVFLWARILALDRSCQVDLVKDNGHVYFLNVLASPNVPSDQRILSLFVLSVICSNCRVGQQALLSGPAPGSPPLPSMLSLCLAQLADPDGMVRKWATLCLAKFWEGYEEAKVVSLKEKAHEKVCALLTDQVPEVRAAAVLALAALCGGGDRSEARTNVEINLGLTLFIVVLDASPMVRRELIFALHELVRSQEARFLDVAAEMLADERERAWQQAAANSANTPKKGQKNSKLTSSLSSLPREGLAARPPDESPQSGASSVYGNIWKTLLALTADPVPELAQLATQAVSRVHAQVSETVKELTQQKQMKKSSSIASFVGLSRSGAGLVATSPRPAAANPANLGAPATPSAIRRNVSAQDLGVPLSGTTSSISVADLSAVPSMVQVDLASSFFEWSCEFFMRPQTKPHEEDETSPAFVERQWRVGRNQAITSDALSIRDAGCKRLDTQVAFLHVHESETSSLFFHPFDPLLAVGDEQGTVSIWALDDGTRVNSFVNNTLLSPAPRITYLNMLNEGDLVPLLLVGSADGLVHVWRGAYQAESLELVSAFRALSDLASPAALSTGLVADWIPEQRMLLVSGDVKDGVVRIWDLERELHVQNIVSHTEALVSTLAHDSASRLVYAGYSDGSIRTYDARTPCRYTALGSAITEHKSPLLRVAVPKGHHSGLVVAAALNGDVKLWDVRKAAVVSVIPNPGGLAALAVHDYASVIACGLPNQKIRATTFTGEEISMIRYHDGFLGQRIGPVSCLAFHPHKVLLAAGATDSIVSVYSGTAT